ncbi:hypothetical protein ACHAWF_005906 [Thalassiosira exigua]
MGNLAIVATALVRIDDGNAFLIHPVCTRQEAHRAVPFSSSKSTQLSSSPSSSDSPKLVSQDAFVAAIDVLKKDMGLEIIPDDQRPLYAIGKLVASLPLEHVGGVRFADCDSLTLVSQLKQSVVDVTGMQSLDTVVAIRAGGDGDDGGYVGDTNGAGIADTAKAYTEAINYAMEHGLKDIELEVNRLVPLMPSEE